MLIMQFPALAFCNDIDFANWSTYKEVHKILSEEFGIPATDSFWLFDPSGSDLALFKGSLRDKGPKHDEILEEIHSGQIDIMHSAGNFSRTNTLQKPSREMIAEGLNYLAEHAHVPHIWTNHGDHGDIQNIGGSQPYYQQGDDPSSEVFIMDLLEHHNVRYFSLDHHTSNNFVFKNSTTGVNPLWSIENTRSGFQVVCFRRFRGDFPKAPTALTLGAQLSDENLNQLSLSNGVSIIYQHWCCHRDKQENAITAKNPIFSDRSWLGLKKLALFKNSGKVCVLKLHELLSSCYDILSNEK
jgi:hypothetical protein